jgi:hypothetical protein
MVVPSGDSAFRNSTHFMLTCCICGRHIDAHRWETRTGTQHVRTAHAPVSQRMRRTAPPGRRAPRRARSHSGRCMNKSRGRCGGVRDADGVQQHHSLLWRRLRRSKRDAQRHCCALHANHDLHAFNTHDRSRTSLTHPPRRQHRRTSSNDASRTDTPLTASTKESIGTRLRHDTSMLRSLQPCARERQWECAHFKP